MSKVIWPRLNTLSMSHTNWLCGKWDLRTNVIDRTKLAQAFLSQIFFLRAMLAGFSSSKTNAMLFWTVILPNWSASHSGAFTVQLLHTTQNRGYSQRKMHRGQSDTWQRCQSGCCCCQRSRPGWRPSPADHSPSGRWNHQILCHHFCRNNIFQYTYFSCNINHFPDHSWSKDKIHFCYQEIFGTSVGILHVW